MQSSFIDIFLAISENGEISRARLSELTGYSQVTVGKAVDLFDSVGIVAQHKQPRSSAGRKTGICSLTSSHAMLLLDFSRAVSRVSVIDPSLTVLGEASADTDDPDELIAAGFSLLGESGRAELCGIGCVVPAGQMREYAQKMTDSLGNPPDLILEADKAFAAANAARFDLHGAAVFLRIGDTIDGAVTYGGHLYAGSCGRAGKFGEIFHHADEIPQKLYDLCFTLDPQLIYIACGDAGAFRKMETLPGILCSLGMDPETLPELVIEPAELSRDVMTGAAMLLREKWLTGILENNS